MRDFRKTANHGISLLLIGCAVPAASWADGAVYAMTNAIGNNQIQVWSRGCQ